MTKDKVTTVHEVKEKIGKFIKDREWDKFHNAKNMSMQIAAEAAELMEHFLWEESTAAVDAKMAKNREEIEQEVADVAIEIICLCNAYGIDLATIIENKMELNGRNYPLEKSKGHTTKYTKL
jgi:MazG nucleotide pyrophosphohydrolase domain.